MAAQSTATQARPAAHSPVASPTFNNPEVESIIAEALENGQCFPLVVDIWRQIGERDINRLRLLARDTPRPSEIEQVQDELTAFVIAVEKVRTFIVAMKFAADEDSQRMHHDANGLDWSTLMDGIKDMIPNEERLERLVSSMLSAHRTFNWGASLQAQRMVPPVAMPEAKQARRDVVSGAAKAAV